MPDPIIAKAAAFDELMAVYERMSTEVKAWGLAPGLSNFLGGVVEEGHRILGECMEAEADCG